MPSLLTTSLFAFLLALALTPGVRAIARRRPGRRKRDARGEPITGTASIPRLGGLAVAAAMALALTLPTWLPWHLRIEESSLSFPWAGPLLLILCVGVMDDWLNLRPRWKFLGQGVAAIWVTLEGLRVRQVFHHALPLPLSIIFTLVWLVGCSNAFNLIDGLDGLATGLALFATGTVLAHAVLIGEPALALITGCAFGALAGFLPYNFPPASIYLGDSGSLGVGFFLGCMALTWANKASTAIGLVAPFFALMVPWLDTTVALARRGLTGQPLFAGDQRHLHHRLLGRFGKRDSVLILYAVAGLGAVGSLLLADLHRTHTTELVILLFIILAGVGVQQLDYTEFSSVRQAWRGRDPRKLLRAQVALQQCSQRLATAGDYETIWTSLEQTCHELEFQGIELRVGPPSAPVWSRNSRGLPARLDVTGGCTCRIPLGDNGTLGMVTFWRQLDLAQSSFLDEMAVVLSAALPPRLAALAPARARAHGAGH